MDPPAFDNPTSLVTLIIGKDEDKKTFLVHREVACEASPVLKAVFESQFIEGQTQTYRLEDTTGRAFKLLMQWMYSRKLNIQQLRLDYEWDEDNDHLQTQSESENAGLKELWVLSDRFCIPVLQNLAIETMDKIRITCSYIDLAGIEYIYSNSSDSSPLRLYTVAKIATFLHADDYHDPSKVTLFPPCFMFDLAALLSKNRGRDIEAKFQILDYLVDV
ncbi:uncharacterized protein PAC_00986 [Phialocephala subalpina]|uniref:BTB domain-containing protein n=1 Tax=Phialocephala subalpina TaxID=576137 RepID=A0A1L7WEA9_9HELO|nr:uncharacterized protein PAC_00986 [Phialocephala subalpina]